MLTCIQRFLSLQAHFSFKQQMWSNWRAIFFLLCCGMLNQPQRDQVVSIQLCLEPCIVGYGVLPSKLLVKLSLMTMPPLGKLTWNSAWSLRGQHQRHHHSQLVALPELAVGQSVLWEVCPDLSKKKKEEVSATNWLFVQYSLNINFSQKYCLKKWVSRRDNILKWQKKQMFLTIFVNLYHTWHKVKTIQLQIHTGCLCCDEFQKKKKCDWITITVHHHANSTEYSVA